MASILRKLTRLRRGGAEATAPGRPPRPRRPTFRLRYTSALTPEELEARRREHDFWYHSYYFDNGYEIRGDYDIGQDVGDYGFPPLDGRSVLDVGTGSGWFATYFEQLGAKVTTLDARGYSDFDVFGRDHYPAVTEERPEPDRVLPDGRGIYYSSVSKGFWIMKEALGLAADFVNARVYEICPDLFGGRRFDLVFMGSVLMHVRDPIGALMAAHSVCADQLIATTFMQEGDEALPLMYMQEGAGDGISWWIPNRSCLVQWLKAAGFSRFEIDRKVLLTADNPWVDEAGNASGVDQVHQLIHAWR